MENNEKKTFNFFAVDQKTKQIPVCIEREVNGKDYMYWGSDNKYPFYLYDLYTRSALLQSIINGCVDYTMGDGLHYNENIQLWTEEVNLDGETLEDIIKRIIIDYWLFNNFALQVIYNNAGSISELYWLDVCKCRLDKDKQKVFYSEEYGTKSTPNVYEYDVFDPNVRRGTSVYFFNGHNGRGVYGLPKYCAAITAIETSVEISKFHLNSILNNFSANCIINFNNGQPSEDVQSDIEHRIQTKFGGAENAGKFMVAWNDSKDNAVSVERIQSDDFDQRYQALKDSTMKDIFISMRATPALFGVNPENNGFSKEEFLEAFELFDKTMIKPALNDILRVMDKILGDNSIVFTPFTIGTTQDITKTNPEA